MSYVLHILLANVLPIGVMIALGFFMGRKFALHAQTLSKLVFHLFMPVFLFRLLLEASISWALAFKVMAFNVMFVLVLALAAEAVIRWRRYEPGMAGAMRNSVLFYNSGNYMIPLNQLVFAGNPNTLAVQAIVSVFQNLLPGTYGVYNANARKGQVKAALMTTLRYPGLYAVAAAIALRGSGVPIPASVRLPIDTIADGTIALALITLGVQLSGLRMPVQYRDVVLSAALRLLTGPAIGFGLVRLMGFEGDIAKALVLSCAAPTALISALIAVEYGQEAEFAAHTVLFSTVASMLTVTLTIFALT
jgi:hypothetical protein